MTNLPENLLSIDFELEEFDGYNMHINRLAQLDYVNIKQLQRYEVLSTDLSVSFEKAYKAQFISSGLSPDMIEENQYQKHLAIVAVLDILSRLKDFLKTKSGSNGHLKDTILNIISGYSVLASLIAEDETGEQAI